MKKEIMERMITEIKGQISEIEWQLCSVVAEFKASNTIEGFEASYAQRDYNFDSPEEDSYEVTWKHVDCDHDFRFSQGNGISHLSWSSWSFSRMNDEEKAANIANSLMYINAVKAMLELLQEDSRIRLATDKAVAEWKKDILPLKEQILSLSKEIEELKTEIINAENKELLEEAKVNILNKKFRLYNSYPVGRRNLCKFVVSQDKKGNFIAEDEYITNKVKLDENDLLGLWKRINKKVKTDKYDFETEQRKYYIAPNIIPEGSFEPEWVEVTEEEYKSK